MEQLQTAGLCFNKVDLSAACLALDYTPDRTPAVLSAVDVNNAAFLMLIVYSIRLSRSTNCRSMLGAATVRQKPCEKVPVGQTRFAQEGSAADAQLACPRGADGVVADACLLLETIQHELEGPGGIEWLQQQMLLSWCWVDLGLWRISAGMIAQSCFLCHLPFVQIYMLLLKLVSLPAALALRP